MRFSFLLRRTHPHDAILRHYRDFWGADRIEEVHWTPDRIAERIPDLHIVKVRPGTDDGMWAFASIGAWRATDGEPTALEFVVVGPSQSAEAMRWLAMTVYYHSGPPENRLGAGHTVGLGESWVPGSSLDSVLISLPYLWGSKLEHCPLADRHVQVLWVLPITNAERTFARENGVDALEARFEQVKLNYLDYFRASVV
jgi:hypothetical protein